MANALEVKYSSEFEIKGIDADTFLPENSTLIIELGESQLTTALFSVSNNEIYRLNHFLIQGNTDQKKAEAFHIIIEKNNFLLKPFRKVMVSYMNAMATLIPNALFQSEEKENYLRFNQEIPNEVRIAYEDVNRCDAKLVYAVPDSIKIKIDQLFPSHKSKHYISVLLESVFSLQKNNSKTIYLHVHETHFDLIILEQQLEFFNTYHYQSADDILYFVMAAYQQSQSDVEKVELKLIGQIELLSDLHQLLQTYIRKVEAIVPPHRPFKTGPFVSLPEHFYFTAFSRLFCE
jgi:hypothetical protein